MRYWKQGFYDYPAQGSVEITEEYWQELLEGQAKGLTIEQDEGGYPTLVESPQIENPTAEDSPRPIAPSPYEELVGRYIRQQYTLSQELAIIRQRDTKPDQWQAYFDHCEASKTRAKEKTTTPQEHKTAWVE